MKGLPGVVEVRNEASQALPEFAIRLDRRRAADFQVTAQQVGTAVQTAIAGTTASELRPEGSTNQTPIVVSIAGGNQLTAQQIEQLPLSTPSGTIIRLGQVAQISPTTAPAELDDQNRQLQVTVSASTGDVPLGTATAEIEQALKQMGLPPGYSFSLSGAAQQQRDIFGPLEGAFALAILLVYMLTAALYESLLYPLAVLLSLPLATVGALAGLTLSGNTLNLYSFMGLIMLMGLVAKNAILLVDFTNTLRARGLSRTEALIQAGRTRLRPIVMTTATMVCAMLPLAIKLGAGAEDRSPMATVLVGGLLTSTLLTLVFVPVVYSYLDDLGQLLARLRARRQPHLAAAPPPQPVPAIRGASED
jgi:HAE1 family hydrophobic/amphiphilic exporter-1